MNEMIDRILGVKKIVRLLRLRDEDTIEEIVDQQPFTERPPGQFGHESGESVVAHMRAMADVGNTYCAANDLPPLFGCDVIDVDAETKRACFECNHVYDGPILCPNCGEAAGEPLGMEE
jgi:hypothetical protein